MLMSFAACSSKDKSKTDNKEVAQELVIGEQFDLDGLDPNDNMLDDPQTLMFNSLVELDTEFKKTPGLAKKWEMSSDGKTWTFDLREDVSFHDGSAWNSEAAKKNVERWQKLESAAVKKVESIETPDNKTLVLKMKEPDFQLASNLTPSFMGIVSPSIIGEDGKATKAIGTGPYKLLDWKKDSEYFFEANEKYWGGKPNLQKITFKVITDPEARAMAMESGEIDMMSGYQSLAAIKRLSADKNKFKIEKNKQNTSSVMFYNLEKEHLNSLEVRQAIGHSLDLKTMVNSLLGDLASAPEGFFSPVYGKIVNEKVKNPEFSLEKASALLEKAGYKKGTDGIFEKDGKKLSLNLTYNSGNQEDALIATAMQDELKKAGIKIELKPIEGAAAKETMKKKDYDMIITGQSFIPNDDPTYNYLNGYWHSKSAFPIYTSEKLDKMINELNNSMDENRRIQLHHEIQKEIMDNAPTVMLYHRNSIRLMDKNVDNFNIASGCWQIYRDIKNTEIK